MKQTLQIKYRPGEVPVIPATQKTEVEEESLEPRSLRQA
jgi:hypothetical protein